MSVRGSAFSRCALVLAWLLTSTAFAQEPSPSPVGPTGVQEETIPRPSRKWPLAFAGAAIGALIVGVALDGAALARANEQNGNAAAPPLYTQDLHDRGEQGKTMAAVGYAFLGIGAGLALVDAVLWYEALRKPQQKKAPAAAWLGPTGVAF
jgi:hypothetical protein